MGKPLRVLVVEDSEEDFEMLVRELGHGGYDLTYQRVETAEAMKAALERTTWDVVLSDFSLPAFSGMAALATMKASGRDLPFIMISGTISEETAVSALKAGAGDFLVKGRLARLVPAIERELRDVAERRERLRLEEQLRHAQKMEAVGQLAGGVAHDFNNLLTAILGYSELLTTQIGPDKPMGQDLREIVFAAERAAALTRQLLAFSRKQALALVPLDLTLATRNIEPMLGRLLGERVRISTELANDVYPVLADATQLDQVLINLSVNARDAMPDGGVLTLRTGNVELDQVYAKMHEGASAGPYAMLSVTDTGTGITPEVQTRMFEPFFTTKARGYGTGLGLAAVYGIVKQLGGYIWVDSQAGEGTTFEIYLPKTARAALTPAPSTRTQSSMLGDETILLVEDEDSVRHFAYMTLRRYGYRVIEAENAEVAWKLFESSDGPIDLLATDIILPGMDGHQLASRIKQARPAIRVLFMSGYAEWPESSRDFLKEGAELLAKPFTAHMLLAKTRHLLGSTMPRDCHRLLPSIE